MAVALLLLTACSKGEPQQTIEPVWLSELKEVLNGSWHGERFSEVTNTAQNEDIVFTSFEEAREVTSLFGSFTAQGVAEIEQYTNDGLLQMSERCLYALTAKSSTGEYCISFYPCDENGKVISKADNRILRLTSKTQFYMRPYGLSEGNDLLYNKK